MFVVLRRRGSDRLSIFRAILTTGDYCQCRATCTGCRSPSQNLGKAWRGELLSAQTQQTVASAGAVSINGHDQDRSWNKPRSGSSNTERLGRHAKGQTGCSCVPGMCDARKPAVITTSAPSTASVAIETRMWRRAKSGAASSGISGGVLGRFGDGCHHRRRCRVRHDGLMCWVGQ
jgi:hypothetical protein